MLLHHEKWKYIRFHDFSLFQLLNLIDLKLYKIIIIYAHKVLFNLTNLSFSNENLYISFIIKIMNKK